MNIAGSISQEVLKVFREFEERTSFAARAAGKEMPEEYKQLRVKALEMGRTTAKSAAESAEEIVIEALAGNKPFGAKSVQMERFCINSVLSALELTGLKKDDEAYKEVSRKTARLIIRDRKGMLTRYQRSQEETKDWLLWKVGFRKNVAFEKMKRMGITGDVMKDMEVLK